jgi:hypothetical protein
MSKRKLFSDELVVVPDTPRKRANARTRVAHTVEATKDEIIVSGLALSDKKMKGIVRAHDAVLKFLQTDPVFRDPEVYSNNGLVATKMEEKFKHSIVWDNSRAIVSTTTVVVDGGNDVSGATSAGFFLLKRPEDPKFQEYDGCVLIFIYHFAAFDKKNSCLFNKAITMSVVLFVNDKE